MTIADWATTISGFLAVAVFVGAVLRWMTKHYLSELKPDGNGGHNLEGRIARIEKQIDSIYNILASKE